MPGSSLRPFHLIGALAAVLGVLPACHDGPTPSGPDLALATADPQPARGGGAVPLTATPTALSFLLPQVTPATVTARVQFVGVITATTSSAQCATVAPGSLPATKPAGSAVYVATFAVTPVGAGTCTITLTDKKGGRAQVAVHVEAALTERMVFVSERVANGEVFVREPDGTVTQLTENFAGGSSPAVAPDGRILVSISGPDHNDEIYIMAADGSGRTRLTFDDPHGPDDVSPTVSPDGQVIVYQRTTAPLSDIQVMGIDGSNPLRLTSGTQSNFAPRLSPDGSKIVFSSFRDGNTDIYVVDADGSSETRLTTDPAGDYGAVFAPDGRIVFGSDRDGNRELYRMDADGSNVTRLTTDPSTDIGPAFTRDGRLVFASDRDGDFEIYLRGANGVLHPLTDDDEDDSSPAF